LSLQKVTVYNSKTGEGNLRNVLIRESRSTGETMIVFFTKEYNLGFEQNVLNDLVRTFPQVVSIYQNINRSPKAVLLGKVFRLLKGEPDLEDALGPFKFKISPRSFFQVNAVQAEILNEKVLEYYLVIVDPPRRGCSSKVLKGIIKIKPKKIIYVSCNPATLSRDLKYFTKDDDYKLKKVLPLDMFPQTGHIECIASLER
jgi:tRNA/tmRNA/rRNA uracil-C5-methylase (TrmA/RlmC/RlmD family)